MVPANRLRSLKFVDLFAGLGGFHLALHRLGHRCVFASEIDPALRDLYELNFHVRPCGDIRTVDVRTIPSHDILCAGFPCQPFSKAGDQRGFDCPKNGDLFDYVVEVVAQRKPRYLFLENVPNLRLHNGGDTWQGLVARLRALGYTVEAERLSPHHFGIPQIRERIFIVGGLRGLRGFKWPTKNNDLPLAIESVLDRFPVEAKPLSDQVRRCLDVWQQFLDAMPADVEFPASPLWSFEFGATYPYEGSTPFGVGARALRSCLGSHGQKLTDVPADRLMLGLPSYARSKTRLFPAWKVDFIRKNREFYRLNRKWIDRWIPRILNFPPSLQKLEWNCRGEERDIWQYVIQFRASGVRIKRRTTAPSLVAMTTTQIPIVAWEKRYMTVKECARLQSLNTLRHWPASAQLAYAALGNAVNARVVWRIAKSLLAPERQSLGRRDSKKAPPSEIL